MNSIDPAHRQIVFKDFSDKLTADERIEFLESLILQHKFKFNSIDHFYSGPKNSRKISKKSYMEFSS